MSKTSNLPALNSPADISVYLDAVKEAIKNIKGNVSCETKTKNELTGYGTIANFTSVSDLIKAAASVRLREKEYKAAAKELGLSLKTYPCLIDGHSPSAWLADIKDKATLLSHKSKLKKLEAIKKKLEENLSKEEKFKRDMADVASYMQDLVE